MTDADVREVLSMLQTLTITLRGCASDAPTAEVKNRLYDLADRGDAALRDALAKLPPVAVGVDDFIA